MPREGEVGFSKLVRLLGTQLSADRTNGKPCPLGWGKGF